MAGKPRAKCKNGHDFAGATPYKGTVIRWCKICRYNSIKQRLARLTPEQIKEEQRRKDANYLKNNKHKRSARKKVAYYLKTGKIVRPEYCTGCLNDCKPEAHHDDYSKPLEVIWLCKSCHELKHHPVLVTNNINKLGEK